VVPPSQPEDTEDDVAELGARDEKEACLDRPVCDLDDSAAQELRCLSASAVRLL